MPFRSSGTSPLRRGAGFRCHRRTLGHSAATGHRSNDRYPCPQTKPGTFGGRVPPSCRPQPRAGPGQQTQARRLVPEYNFGPAPSAAPGRLAQSAFLGSHALSGRIDVAADRKRHHAATGGGMEGRSTNAVLRHHQLRHVPFLGETRTVGAARARQVQTQRSAHRGLALLVSWDFHIPVFSQIYQGNQNDSLTFSRVLDDLVARYRMFREKCHSITLVFDKGNNSEETFQHLEGSPYHFIGSLVPTQHQDLLNILLEQFRSLEDSRFAGVRVYRTQKEVFGEKRTIVITRSRALLRGQILGIRQHLAKKLRALRDLEKRISRSHEPGWKGKPYTPESIQKNLDTIISGQYVADFLWD